MKKERINLASDNWAGVHPEILDTLSKVNVGSCPAYGGDSFTLEVKSLIQEKFKALCDVFFVTTGTSSNVLSLALATPRYGSVVCSEVAHIQTQESGAFEGITGCKLILVEHICGKITPESVRKKVEEAKFFGRHGTLPKVLSITQPTEFGTVYSLEELALLKTVCREFNLMFHIDGSRLYNALVTLGVDFAEFYRLAQMDVLSLGGTKNGLMGAEAVVVFNTSLFSGADHMQKRLLQLNSKTRFISSQYLPFLSTNLWYDLAQHANTSAREIADLLRSFGIKIIYPVQTNQIFFECDQNLAVFLKEHLDCYIWSQNPYQMRFVTSWSFQQQEQKELARLLSLYYS